MLNSPDVLLNSKTTAALIGLSIYTLQRARHDRHDLEMPPVRRVGARGVAYSLRDVIRWAQRRSVQLRWDELPLRVRLDAVECGVHVPVAVALARVAPTSGNPSGR